MATVNLKCTSS